MMEDDMTISEVMEYLDKKDIFIIYDKHRMIVPFVIDFINPKLGNKRYYVDGKGISKKMAYLMCELGLAI